MASLAEKRFAEMTAEVRKNYGYNEEKKKKGQSGSPSAASKFAAMQDEIDSAIASAGNQVDGNFISTFITDANNFFTQSQTDWDSLDWKSGTDQSKTQTRRNTWNDLSSRANAIRKYADANKGGMGTEAYNELISYLDGVTKTGSSLMYNFYDRGRYYSQWDTEDAWIKGAAENWQQRQQRYEANKKRIEELTAERERAAKEQRERGALATGFFIPGLNPAVQEIDAEIAALRAENTQYELGEGGWVGKGYDDNRGVTGSADFEANSGYVSTKEDGFFGSKYGDLTYEIINGNTDAWSDVAVAQAWGKISDDEYSKLLSYEHMSKEDIGIYNYLYATKGKEAADAFLGGIQAKLNYSQGTQIANQITAIENDFVRTLAASTYGVFGVGPDQFNSGITQFFTNEAQHTSSAQYANQQVAESMDGFGEYVYNASVTVGNMLPSIIVSMAFGQHAGSVAMGLSSAGNAYGQALKEGYSESSARTYGVLVGASEALLQDLIGGISSLGGFTSEKLLAKVAMIDDALLRVATKMGIKIGSEILEEEVQNYLEPAFRTILFGEDYDAPTVQELIETAIITALSTGALEGPGTISSDVAQTHAWNRTGSTIVAAEGGVDALKALAMEKAGVSEASMAKLLTKQAGKVSGEVATGKGIIGTIRANAKNARNATRVGRLYNTVQAANNQANASANQADIAKSLQRKGFNEETANDIATALVAQYNGQELTKAQEKLLKSMKDSPEVMKVVSDIIDNVQSTMGQRSQNIRDFWETVGSGLGLDAFTKQIASKEFTPKGELTVSKDGKAHILDTDEEIDIKGVAEIKDGEVLLDIGDGKTISAKDVSFGSEDLALVYEAVANLSDKIDAETANKFIARYDGGNALAFAKGMTQAYSYGFYGYDRSEMAGKKTMSGVLSEKQRNYAYGLGEQYRQVKDQKDKENAHTGKAPAERGVFYRDKDGNDTDIGEYMKKAGSNLSKRQRTAIGVMRRFSEMMGVRFHVFEIWTENGKTYYLNQDGKKTEGNPNGFYDQRTGEIYIALDAGAVSKNGFRDTMLFTIAHELTHYMKQWSPEHFTRISKIVFSQAGFKGNVAALVAKKMASRKNSISYETAVEEVVADAMETILKDGKVVEFMAEVKKQDYTAWQKLKSWFRKLEKFLLKLVDAYKDEQANTYEGRMVADFAEDTLRQIQRIWAEGDVAAGDRYQGAPTTEAKTVSAEAAPAKAADSRKTTGASEVSSRKTTGGTQVAEVASTSGLTKAAEFDGSLEEYIVSLIGDVSPSMMELIQMDSELFKSPTYRNAFDSYMAQYNTYKNIAWETKWDNMSYDSRFMAIYHAMVKGHEAYSGESKRINEVFDRLLEGMAQPSTGSIRGNADGAVPKSEVTTALVKAPDGGVLKSERTEYEYLPKQMMNLTDGSGTILSLIEGLTGKKVKGLGGKDIIGYTGRDVRSYAMGISGFTQAQIKEVNKFMDAMSEFMDKAGVTYKFIGLQDVKDAKLHYTYNADGSIKSIVLSAMVKNGDYPVNFDLSSICKKREAMSKLMDKLAKRGSLDSGIVKLTPDNIFKINTALKDAGYETACLGCFVESKRYNSLEWAKKFCSKWNAAVKKVNPNATFFGYGDATFNEDSFTLEQAIKVDEAATRYITATKTERLANALAKYRAKEQAGLPLVEGKILKVDGVELNTFSKAARKRLMDADISEELKTKYLTCDVSTLNIADVEFLLENGILPGAALSNKQAVTEMVKSGEAYQHLLRPSDLLTDRGISKLEALPNFHGVLYGHYGSGTPKLMQSYTPYNSEIALLPSHKGDQTLAEYLYKIAGVRMQSFSDFQIQNIYDYLQMVADLAARKLPAHAYTKEISFAKLLGMTGIKVNLSVMFDIDPMVDKAHAGLTKLNKLVHRGEYARVVLEDEQGKWVYNIGDYQTQRMFAEAFPDEAKRFLQSIGFADAVKLQSSPGYSANCGIIGVGYSDLGIFAMLDDNRIRYIIPYHASSLPAEIKLATNIALGTDYTPYQNNMKISGIVDRNGNAVNWSVKEAFKRLGSGQAVINELNEKIRTEGWVVKTTKAQNGHGSYGLYEDLMQTNDPRQTASNFMDWCCKNGTLPLFYQFASHQNYYKLLYDFNVYDCVTEEYAPQQAVTNTYPTMVDGQVQPGNVTDGGFDAEYFQGTVDKQMAFMNEYSRNRDADLERLAENMEEGDYTLFSERASNQELAEMDDTALYIKNTDKANYIGMIFNGTKTEETRSRRTLDAFIGKDFYVTDGKYVYGSIVLGEPHKYTEAEFRKLENRKKHRVPTGDEYDIKPGGIKWAYPIESYKKFAKPKKLSDSTEYKNSFQARQVLYSDRQNGENILAGQGTVKYSAKFSERDNAPAFYSQMAMVVDGMKQEKFGASSVISMLRGKGVKAEEIKWSGIETWLEGKKSVTKAELQEFIAGSMLQIEEQERGDTKKYSPEQQKRLNDLEYEIEAAFDEMWELWESEFGEDLPFELLDSSFVERRVKKIITTANEEAKTEISEDSKRIIQLAHLIDINKEEAENISYQAVSPEPKWGKYKLDGGENYREIVFTLPNSSHTNQAMRAHWGEDAEGILAHARIQDFIVNGKKMLFIEEIQSDWHNEGHKEGYRKEGEKTDLMLQRESKEAYEEFYTAVEKMVESNANWEDDNAVYYAHPVVVAEMFEGNESHFDRFGFTDEQRETIRSMVAEEAARQAAMKTAPKHGAAPDAPFRETYHEYVLKRLIRMAAEQGYDSIGWTTADIQNERWSRKYAEGYRIEYDQDIPKFLRKYGKKWGATVGKTSIDTTSIDERDREMEALGYIDIIRNYTEVWQMDVTDAMKESVMTEGQPLYSERDFPNNAEAIAKEYFGTTTKWAETGWLLRDGTQLDFSGRHWERDPENEIDLGESYYSGKRNMEHYEIAEAFPELREYSKMEYRGEHLDRFMNRGNIRIVGKGIIGLEAMPTEEQFEKLRSYFRENIDRGIVVGIGRDGMNFKEGTNPSIIIEGIRDYFSRNRESQSELMRFHTMFQEREEDSVSDRALLAGALEELVRSPKERELIDQYQRNISKMEEVQERLKKLRAEIRNLTNAKGDKAKIEQMSETAKELADLIDRYDRELLKLQATKPLRDVLARARSAAYQKAKKSGEKALKEYQQQVSERFDRGVEGRRKTEIRKKIRKVIRDLDKILNRGDKKRNVKEDMKDFVAEALSAAEVLFTDNYTNEDMLRNGFGVELSEEEARYAKEAQDILEEIAALPYGSYEAMQARQEAEEKLRSKLAYRMSKLKDAFFRERQRLNKTEVAEVLGKLADAYAKLETSEYAYVNGAYHEAVHEYLKMLQEDVGGAKVKDMTLSQLQELYKAYTMVLTTVRNANRMFADGLKLSKEEIANLVMTEVYKAGGEHGLWSKGQLARNPYSWNNTKPIYAAERTGSSTFVKLVMGLFNGQYKWATDMEEAKAFRQKVAEKYGFKSWDMEKTYKFTSSSGIEFELNLNQIMSLYAYAKREQAHDHLLKGGFVFGKNTEVVVTKNGIKRTYLNRSAKAHNISDEIMDEIVSTLTEKQKGFVDEMQDYLSTTMGNKGNEVSMRLYGVKLFMEQFYFPLRSAGQFKEKAKEAELKQQQGQISIANSGFTHATTPKASNPVVLDGFTDVWASHVNEMSLYHSMVLPMEDFRRVYNYSTVPMEGQEPVGVNSTLENAYGPEATGYFDQLYNELNGGAIVDPREDLAKKAIGRFKKSAVMLSNSVWVQQFSAIGRAFALIDPKHFIGAKVDKQKSAAAWEELKQYAPVAIIKEMGGFDTHTGLSAKDYLLAEEYGKGERVKGFIKDEQYRDEIMGLLPAKADQLTWCAIWEAVKRETKAQNPGMDVKSEAFLKKAGERFSEVIEKTQVYDSVLARSANMRSKNGLMQMLTAFMAEPTTTVNMVEDALRKGNKKTIARTFGAVATSIILNNALVSIIYAMRDDDEDETFLEKYFQAFTSGMLDDINPMTYYPILKDIWSLFQGYDIERSDMAIYSDIADSVKKVVTLLANYDSDMDEDDAAKYHKQIGDALMSLLDAGAAAFGVPLKNARRDLMSYYNTFKTLTGGKSTTWNSFVDAIGGAALDTIPVVGWVAGKSKTDELYDAIVSGDTAYVERLRGGYKDEAAYNIAVRKALRENDPRIHEAAVARMNGDLGTYTRIAKEIIAEGHFSQDYVVAAINAEINAIDKGESTTTSAPKASGLYKAEDFAVAISQGNAAMANAIKVDIIKTAQQNGKTQEEAEKGFVSSATSACKELFLSGDISENQAIDALVTYCDKTEDEAMADVQYWAFKQDYPEAYADDQWFDTYYEKIADSGLPIDVYMDYRNTVSTITGEGKKEKRMAVINSLPITSAQKDALYFAEGWAESKLYEAPWH